MPRLEIEISTQQARQEAQQVTAAIALIGQEAVETQADIDRMADGAQADLNRMGTSARAAGTQLEAMSAATQRATTASAGMRGSVQNAAFQVQDFAVQVAAGTSASRAFAQQVPQLLGGFGVWGAAIGAVVAVLAGLAPVLLSTAAEAETLSDTLDRVAEAQARTERATKLAEASVDDLTAKYGELTDAIRDNIAAQLRFARVGEEIAVADQFEGVLDRVREITQEISAFDDIIAFTPSIDTEAIELFEAELETALSGIQASLGLTEEQVRLLQAALIEYGDTAADDFPAQERALIAIRDALAENEAIYRTLPEPMRAFVDEITKAIDQLQTMTGTADDVKAAVDGITERALVLASAFSTAAAEFARIPGDFAISADEYTPTVPGSERVTSPFDPNAFVLNPEDVAAETLALKRSRTPGGTRTRTRTSTEAGAVDPVDFGTAKAGLYDWEREAERVAEETKAAFAEVGTTAADAVAGLIDGTLEWDEALAQVISSLGRILVQMAEAGRLNSFSDLGSLFSGPTSQVFTGGVGAAISGAVGSFATGGYTGGTRGQVAGLVHGEEFVFDAAATRRIGVGNLEAIRQGRGARGGVSVSMPVQIDASNSGDPQMAAALITAALDDFSRNRLAPAIRDIQSREFL